MLGASVPGAGCLVPACLMKKDRQQGFEIGMGLQRTLGVEMEQPGAPLGSQRVRGFHLTGAARPRETQTDAPGSRRGKTGDP